MSGCRVHRCMSQGRVQYEDLPSLCLSRSLIHSSRPLFIKSCQSSLSQWGFDRGSAVRNETPRLSAKRFISRCCCQSDRAPIALSYSLQRKHIYGQVKMPLMLWQQLSDLFVFSSDTDLFLLNHLDTVRENHRCRKRHICQWHITWNEFEGTWVAS